MSPQPAPRPNPKQEQANRNTYIPQHVRAEMDRQMQKNLPAHLKQYSGAYMQQTVYDPSANRAPRPMQNVAPSPTYKPVTHLNREDHYVQYRNRMGQSDDAGGQSAPAQDADQPQPVSPEQAYDFIVNPDLPQTRRSLIPSNSSLPVKIALIGGALLVALIIIVVLKGIFAGGSNFDSFITVAQDQQELIQLTKKASQEQNLSEANQNFTATASLSLSSSQSQLISYLANNGQKVKSNLLLAKISANTTSQLSAASTAGTYNETYKDLMKTKLTAYKRDLKQTYDVTDGPNGRELLSDQYDQAELLLTQLSATKS